MLKIGESIATATPEITEEWLAKNIEMRLGRLAAFLSELAQSLEKKDSTEGEQTITIKLIGGGQLTIQKMPETAGRIGREVKFLCSMLIHAPSG